MEAAFPVSLVIKSALVREGLKRILLDNGFDVHQSVADPEALNLPLAHDERIIIFDCALIPSETGRALRDMIAKRPQARLILLSESFNFDLMNQAFQAGAYAYVLQDTKLESFLSIIQLVSFNEKVAPTEFINNLRTRSNNHSDDDFCRIYGLSEREKAILDCLIMGMPNKLISREIKVSEATVKLTIKALFRKLDVKNRTQAAVLAHEVADSSERNHKG